MEEKHTSFIITITGPSQSGKTLVLNKLDEVGKALRKKGYDFHPTLVQKETTRELRVEELAAIDEGKKIDVKHVEEISADCDLVYQTYGKRYGINTKELRALLDEGKFPYAVVNDIRSVEALKKAFPNRVLSIFLFRKIPDLSDFRVGAENRGNVSEEQIQERYAKAVAIYRMYIENIALFDRVILNAIEYSKAKLNSKDCIIDRQITNIITGVFNGKIQLRRNSAALHSDIPKTFVIAGNSASGKDELVRAIQSMGKMDAEIIPKYTVRKQEKDDENEMICQFIPNEKLMETYTKKYEDQLADVLKKLDSFDRSVIVRFRKDWEEMKSRIVKKIKKGRDMFWEDVAKATTSERENFYQKNPNYIDLCKVEKEGELIYVDEIDQTKLVRYEGEEYIVYRANGKIYGFKLKETHEGGKYHVVVASNLGVFNLLKKRLGNNNVAIIYSHSQISEKEYLKNSNDISAKEKVKAFDKTLNDYVDNIVNYDHVTIYAQSQLLNAKTIEEEELIDQIFRLFRVY